MTVRLHDPGHLPHLLRRVPRPRHPARVAQGHDHPAVDPRRSAPSSSASSTCPTWFKARRRRLHHPLRALRRADVRLPGDRPRRVQLVARAGSRPCWPPLGIFAGLPVLLAATKSPFTASRDADGAARPGLHGAREQVLPRPPLHRRHRRRRQGPDRPGVLLVQPATCIDARRQRRRQRRRRSSAGVRLPRTSTRRSSTASSSARAPAPRSPARCSATSRPARSSSTPPSSSPARPSSPASSSFVV